MRKTIAQEKLEREVPVAREAPVAREISFESRQDQLCVSREAPVARESPVAREAPVARKARVACEIVGQLGNDARLLSSSHIDSSWLNAASMRENGVPCC